MAPFVYLRLNKFCVLPESSKLTYIFPSPQRKCPNLTPADWNFAGTPARQALPLLLPPHQLLILVLYTEQIDRIHWRATSTQRTSISFVSVRACDDGALQEAGDREGVEQEAGSWCGGARFQSDDMGDLGSVPYS